MTKDIDISDLLGLLLMWIHTGLVPSIYTSTFAPYHETLMMRGFAGLKEVYRERDPGEVILG